MTDSELRRYHEETKHRIGRPSATPYGLDWHNQPELFKRYPELAGEAPPEDLARLLELGAGVHPRRRSPHYRIYMSAGALHPLELYVATSEGLFHLPPPRGNAPTTPR